MVARGSLRLVLIYQVVRICREDIYDFSVYYFFTSLFDISLITKPYEDRKLGNKNRNYNIINTHFKYFSKGIPIFKFLNNISNLKIPKLSLKNILFVIVF